MIKNIKFDDSDLPTISCCMIVKNEETNLRKYLAPIASVFDELIIVDTGSSDGTVEIAKELGAKVFFFPWMEDFAAARNVGLNQATKDYIFWFDADDEIAKQDIARLKFHLKNHPGQVHLHLVDFQGGMRFDSHQLRVFPNNPKYRFSGKIHEQVAPALDADHVPTSYLDAVVIHRGYENEGVLKSKLERNMALLRKEVERTPEDFQAWFTLGRTALSLGLIQEGARALDKCFELYESGEVVYKEHIAMAYVTKAAILPAKDSIKLLEKGKTLFPDFMPLSATLGETYFRNKMYEKAYKTLLPFRNGEYNVGLYPMDIGKFMAALKNFLAISSLVVGDFKTAEKLFAGFIKDPDFKINKGNK